MSFASAARARRGRLLSRAEAHAYIRALGKAFHAWCVVFPSDSAQHTCTQSLLCASRWLPLLLPLLLSSTPPRLLFSSSNAHRTSQVSSPLPWLAFVGFGYLVLACIAAGELADGASFAAVSTNSNDKHPFTRPSHVFSAWFLALPALVTPYPATYQSCSAYQFQCVNSVNHLWHPCFPACAKKCSALFHSFVSSTVEPLLRLSTSSRASGRM